MNLPAATSPLCGCRGSGRQGTGAATNLASYWCLGVPLAALLAFRWAAGTRMQQAGLLAPSPAAAAQAEAGPGRAVVGDRHHKLLAGGPKPTPACPLAPCSQLGVMLHPHPRSPPCSRVQGSVMTLIAFRFDFEREAAKAAARSQARPGSLDGADQDRGSCHLQEPLLVGVQCGGLAQPPPAADALVPQGPSSSDKSIQDGPYTTAGSQLNSTLAM